VSLPLLQKSHSAVFSHFLPVSRVITSTTEVPLGCLQPLPAGFTCDYLCYRSHTRLSSATSRQFHVSSPLSQKSHPAIFNHFPAVSRVIASAVGVPLGYFQPLPCSFTRHHLCCRSPTRLSSATFWRFHVSSPLLQKSHSAIFNHFPAV
jgi:hypothetical protein